MHSEHNSSVRQSNANSTNEMGDKSPQSQSEGPSAPNKVRESASGVTVVRRRSRQASIIELSCVLFVFLCVCVYYVYQFLVQDSVRIFGGPITSFVFVSSGFAVFVEY